MPLALVTGASRGLGHALALALAPTHHVVAVARTQGGLEELDDKVRASGRRGDPRPHGRHRPEAMRQLARALFDRWGRLDLWVHTPSMRAPSRPRATSLPKDLDKSIATNLRATADLIGTFSPLLGERAAPSSSTTPAGREVLRPLRRHEGRPDRPRALLGRRGRAHRPPRPDPPAEPMATATRARFFPGEDRAALATPAQEAQRLLPQILA
jgi:NAD(P)-dependent dehydrogenase (short-subunit alcohol dehydrogenase family)